MSFLPPELTVFLLAMLPVTELRAALPLALTVYNMSVVSAFIFSVLGNIVPAVLLMKFLEPVSAYLIRRYPLCDRFFSWLFMRTRTKFTAKYERWGEIALLLFVAVPLPVTGVWTGSVAAFLFNIPPKRAVLLMLGGLSLSGIIVTGVTLGLFKTIV